jgi:pantetheine-phosphate adenylyltransferase
MKTLAIYPGTFDPITNGHLDIITRATKLFDHVIVAVAASARKTPAFDIKQRLHWVNTATQSFANVEAVSFSGLLVDFAKKKKAKIILRGLRALADFEYELQLLGMNRQLAPEIETLFLAPTEQFAFISSSIVREIAEMGGDVSAFVPKSVAAELTLH